MSFLAFFGVFVSPIIWEQHTFYRNYKILPVAQMTAADVKVVGAKFRHFQCKLYWKSSTQNTLFCHFWFPGCLQTPEGTYKFTLVRASDRVFRSYSLDRLIFFWFFAWSCVSIWLRWPLKIFWSKFFFSPQMAKNGQNLAIFGQNSDFECFWLISSKRRYKFS